MKFYDIVGKWTIQIKKDQNSQYVGTKQVFFIILVCIHTSSLLQQDKWWQNKLGLLSNTSSDVA